MAKQSKQEVDPQVLSEARNLWGDFKALIKWSVIGIALILVFILIFIY
jgi:uncharacterized membrane protein YvbJ